MLLHLWQVVISLEEILKIQETSEILELDSVDPGNSLQKPWQHKIIHCVYNGDYSWTFA